MTQCLGVSKTRQCYWNRRRAQASPGFSPAALEFRGMGDNERDATFAMRFARPQSVSAGPIGGFE